MIPQIKNILYATDLSDHALKTMGYAISLAHVYEAALTVIHVYETASPNAELLAAAYLGYKNREEMQQRSRVKIIDEIKARLDNDCRELGCRLPECRFQLSEIRVETGKTARMLIDHADSGKFDCMVLGHHHYGRIEEALMGSRSNRVLRESSIPILLVPVNDKEE